MLASGSSVVITTLQRVIVNCRVSELNKGGVNLSSELLPNSYTESTSFGEAPQFRHHSPPSAIYCVMPEEVSQFLVWEAGMPSLEARISCLAFDQNAIERSKPRMRH